jgi:endonuclease/exonuclease/phosphatase family metal-dependent hydrolase
MRRVVKILKVLAGVALLLFAGAWIVTSTTNGPGSAVVPIGELQAPAQLAAGDPIRVMTVNLAHGRSDGFHQALRRTSTIKANLAAVAALIERERIDVVGVQEADGPCIWSGRFDHVEYVAQQAQSAQHLRGEHVKGLKLSYGTGLISRLALAEPLSRAFDPSPPTFTKGFVVATLTHPDVPGGIDVASVHLDFARKSVRARQITTLIETLKARGRPLIVMGDFNTEYSADGPIGRLMEALDLQAWSPEGGEKTFKFTNKRLDWILIPKGWRFVEHAVLPDVVSDHQPVRVTIAVR